MTRPPRKQIHLAAHFPGVNNTTVWSDPRSGSHIDFRSFVHLARTAERAKFDFFFLAEGLRLREHNGRIHDLDVVGRPDTFTVLAALAAVTDRIGLTGTINSTFNEPFEVARQFASLDHLSGGRAGWNVVTSWDAFTGENFRRGGFLPQDQRYDRAEAFLRTAIELFDSWRGDEVLADKESGRFLADADAGRFSHRDPHFDIHGHFPVPRSPQGRPVILQAGDSDAGREFAAAGADAIFTGHGTLEAGQAFYADVKGRLARHGRTADDLLVLPAATFVLADTDADAHALAREVSLAQNGGQTALRFLEQVWARDLSGYDPDGPLPDLEPAEGENTVVRGRASARAFADRQATVARWRARAEAEGLSIRELVVAVSARQTFVGSPATIADQIDHLVQADAADGFILVPYLTPGGLDDFADRVVPLLQERGSFRTEYTGTTLREHLGLREAGAQHHAAQRRAGRCGRDRAVTDTVARGVPDEAVLDNPVWASLTGRLAHLAHRHGAAAAFLPGVSPFAALADPADPAGWRDLSTLVGPGVPLAVTGPALDLPPGWQLLGGGEGVQLLGDGLVDAPDPQARVLGADDVPDMLDLVARTEPGPFLPRTIELGDYLGIRRGGRLVAMAGERLRPSGWTEISAVCTDPQFQGQGLATGLVRAVAHVIRERGDRPFLHTAATNTRAIGLYLALGFTERRRTRFVFARTPTGTG